MSLSLAKNSIAIAAETPARIADTKKLAEKLALPLTDIDSTEFSLLLVYTADHLELRDIKNKKTKPIYVDFLGDSTTYRRRQSNYKNELIARACRVKQKFPLTILDATAGFGRDAFVLANLGHNITLLERSPIMAALLADGIKHALTAYPELSMMLIETDAKNYLQQLSADAYPDVIYLDPMFPHRTKSALVKKSMRLLRDLIGEDEDAEDLLQIALVRAKYRVVVKRPRLAPALGDTVPNFEIMGKSCRFDVYCPAG